MKRIFIFLCLISLLSVLFCEGQGGSQPDQDTGDDMHSHNLDGSWEDITIPDGSTPTAKIAITGLSPNRGSIQGGQAVVISGAGMTNAQNVIFGDVPGTNLLIVSDSELRVNTPAHAEGSVDLKVSDAAGETAVFSSSYTYEHIVPAPCQETKTVFEFDTANALEGNCTGATQVHVAGVFTNWKIGKLPMEDLGGGIFKTEVALHQGIYEYKYICNDTNWTADDTQPIDAVFDGNNVKTVTNPCDPVVTLNGSPYGEIYKSGNVRIEATYVDSAANSGINTNYIELTLNDLQRVTSYTPPASAGATGTITAEFPIGGESPLRLSDGEYRFSLRAMDNKGHYSDSVFGYFVIKTAPEVPIANAGMTQFVRVGEKVLLDGALSKDPNKEGIIEYTWTQMIGPEISLTEEYKSSKEYYYGNDPNQNKCEYPTCEPEKTPSRQSFTPTEPGLYRFSLVVKNQAGLTSANADNTVDVYVLNQKIFNTGKNIWEIPVGHIEVTTTGNQITIDASKSFSRLGQQVNYCWNLEPKNKESLSVPESCSFPDECCSESSLTISKPATAGNYYVYLTVQDALGYGDPQIAMIKVKANGELTAAIDYNETPAWTKSAQIYETFVRHFYDGNQDMIGDLQGLTQKLDYLKGLGVDTIWVMPIFDSRDHDHGYHTTEYYFIERDYGTNADFKQLIKAIKERGMKIVIDFVINHSSRKHPFFLQAYANPDSKFGDFYIWFDKENRYYGYGRNNHGMLSKNDGWKDIPDLNLSNPLVVDYFFGMCKYWMDPNGDGDFSDGIDGLRLDHVTGPEHIFWKHLRKELKELNPDIFLLAESFDNEEVLETFYHNEFDMAFTFPYMWDIVEKMKWGGEDKDIRTLANKIYRLSAADPTLNWPSKSWQCPFFENHDLIVDNGQYYTSYVYFGGSADDEYAQAKVNGGLNLIFSMPGTPQLYNGQELLAEVWRGDLPWINDGATLNTVQPHYQTILNLRKEHPTLAIGKYRVLEVRKSGDDSIPKKVMALERYTTAAEVDTPERLLVINNIRSYDLSSEYGSQFEVNLDGMALDPSQDYTFTDLIDPSVSYTSPAPENDNSPRTLTIDYIGKYGILVLKIDPYDPVTDIKTIDVTFALDMTGKSIPSGYHVYVTGNQDKLGNWIPGYVELEQAQTADYEVTLAFDPGTGEIPYKTTAARIKGVQYKFVLMNPDNWNNPELQDWETFSGNRDLDYVVRDRDGNGVLKIRDKWGVNPSNPPNYGIIDP